MLERSVEPRDEVETLAVVGETVDFSLVAQREQNLVGDGREEVMNEWPVDVVQCLELREVVLQSSAELTERKTETHLVDTLSTEESINFCLAILASLEERRGVCDLDLRVS